MRRNDQHTTSEETESNVVMEGKVEAPMMNEGNFEDVDIVLKGKSFKVSWGKSARMTKC